MAHVDLPVLPRPQADVTRAPTLYAVAPASPGDKLLASLNITSGAPDSIGVSPQYHFDWLTDRNQEIIPGAVGV